jgi:hypothetical protein
MTLFRFTVDAGANAYGGQFEARFAASTFDGEKLLRSSLMPTVPIADGTTLETDDKVTVAVLDQLAETGEHALGVGVSVARVDSAAQVTNYDVVVLSTREATPLEEGTPLDLKLANSVEDTEVITKG